MRVVQLAVVLGVSWRYPAQRTCSIGERKLKIVWERTYCGEGSRAKECQREGESKGAQCRHDEERSEGLVGFRLVLVVQVPRLQRTV